MSKYRSAAGTASSDRVATLPLRRVPGSGVIAGVITTRDLREVWTHFHRGRTVGCSRPDCPGCESSCPQRYEAYVGLYSPPSKKHIILGLTVGAVRQIVDQIGRLDSIRGLVISATRASKRPNARVVLETGLVYADMSALPASFEVLEHLERIWGVEHEEDVKNSIKHGDEAPKSPGVLSQQGPLFPAEERWTIAKTPGEDELDGQAHFFGS